MFSSFYPRQPSPAYYHPSPYYQQSPYARALAQQQHQQQEQRARAYAQELERQRLARSRYVPDEEDEEYYLTPRQRAILEARRRQAALEQRRLDAARMAHEQALKQQQAAAAAQQEERAPAPQSSPPRCSVSPVASESPSRRSPSPTAHVPEIPAPSSPSPERLEEAATIIQTHYRTHRSLRSIAALESQFTSLKSSFVSPTTIDYQSDGRVVSVPVPTSIIITPNWDVTPPAKLAFTPTNVPLHTYMELLSRLLVSLDAVESRGDARVRDRRRQVVRAVEAEAARIEAFWRAVWAAHQSATAPDEGEEEVQAMVVDEPVPELVAPESESEDDPELDFVTPPGTPAPKLTAFMKDGGPEEEKDFVFVPLAQEE